MGDRGRKKKPVKLGIRNGGGFQWGELEVRLRFGKGRRATATIICRDLELIILKPKGLDDRDSGT